MSYIRPRSNTALVFSSVLALFLQTGHSQAAGIGWRTGGIVWRGVVYRTRDLAAHQRVRV